METTRFVDTEKGIVITTVTGKITVAEIRADITRLRAQPNYTPDMPGIVDMRGATAGLTSDELRQIADVVKNSPKTVSGARRALLVGSDFMYGLYRMFAAFASDGSVEYQVFRDEKNWRLHGLKKKPKNANEKPLQNKFCIACAKFLKIHR